MHCTFAKIWTYEKANKLSSNWPIRTIYKVFIACINKQYKDFAWNCRETTCNMKLNVKSHAFRGFLSILDRNLVSKLTKGATKLPKSKVIGEPDINRNTLKCIQLRSSNPCMQKCVCIEVNIKMKSHKAPWRITPFYSI